MKKPDGKRTSEESESIRKLKEAYIRDEGFPEELAEARASSEIRGLGGRTDDSFDAPADMREKGEQDTRRKG